MPHDDTNLDWSAIAQFVLGDMPEDARAAFAQRFEHDSALRDAVAQVRHGLAAADGSSTVTDQTDRRQRAIDRLTRAMDADGVQAIPASRDRMHAKSRRSSPMPEPRRRWLWAFTGITAVLVMTIAGIAIRGHAGPSEVRAEGVMYTTAPGERRAITLRDGSRVILASRSQLTVPGAFGSSTRDVMLTGEAYFDVHAAARIPFVVRTGAVATRVLGTTFDVRRYPGDRATQVAVISGRVAAGGRTTPVVLAGGSIGSITDSSVAVTLSDDPSRVSAWTTGQLVFYDTPIPTVLATLERWYGLEFRIADTALASHHVSVTLSIDKPTDAMNILKNVLGVSMTRDGNVITLRPERRLHHAPSTTNRRDYLNYSDREIGR